MDEKVRYYHRAKVPIYVIADARETDDERELKLIGYRYALGATARTRPDDRGRIRLEALGLSLGVTRNPGTSADRLACYDLETGEEVGDYSAVDAARVAAKARAEAEARARAEAKARAEAEGQLTVPRPRRGSASWKPS